ncbi:MAG: extracellular solute-binding protein [Proteobacteria bacterium]|nr:extracellular solute-binding protein [Pseudomonadota bacterium]MCP4921745.1 extracellular solute-binding protein [Pseudomonadota bacterium]
MSSVLLGALIGTASGAEIVVWHSYRGAEREGLEQALDAYEEASGNTVKPLALPNEGFTKKFESAAPHGNGPDVLLYAHERIGDWSQSGLIEPITTTDSVWAQTTVDAVTWEGQVWAVPLAYKCIALFYDSTVIAEPPATTDELLALAREHTHGDTFGLSYEVASAYVNAAWMHGHGAVLEGPDGVLRLDRDGAAQAMSFVAVIADEVAPQEPTGAIVTQLFNDGKTPMVLNGPWFLGEIEPGTPYAVAPLPVVSETGEHAAPYLTVEGAFVSGHSLQKAQAAELATFLATPEAARIRAEVGRQTVATDIELEDPVLAAFAAQLEHTVPLSNQPQMGATWEPMARAWRRVLRGDLEPDAALAKAQQEFEIVTRPPPPEANPVPYIVVMVLLFLAAIGYLAREISKAEVRAEMHRWRFAYGYIAPAALAMGLLVVLPFVVGAGVSFFAYDGGEFTFVGMAHYADIVLARDWSFTSPQSFYYTLVVTVLWTVANVVLHVTIGVALAMLLREKWVRMRGVFRVLLILPWAIPNYITALIWKLMFHTQFGAINGILALLGVEPVTWFGSFSTAFAANLATNTWLGFPFMMVVTLGALQSIPRDLEQAAEVDGASGWQRFRHITLPLLRPALLPAVILGSVWTFNMFNIIYLVSGGEPDGSTEILISEAYRWAFTRDHQYGYAAAYAVLIFGALLLYSRFTNRLAGQKVL